MVTPSRAAVAADATASGAVDPLEYRFRAERLMVIVPDRLSDLIEKGEVTDRYYNPGELFREVHLVMINDDRPDPVAVQPMVGDAMLHLHNLPYLPRMFYRTLGYRPSLLRPWANQAVMLARNMRPQLVRCHGTHLGCFAARQIKRALGIPYAVSLHTYPDQPLGKDAKTRFLIKAVASAAKIGLREADIVLPVYESLLPYLEGRGVSRISVAYNVLNPVALREKTDYRIYEQVHVVSVGRQISGKSPECLIHAIRDIPEVHLTVVGDGPHHDRLVALVENSGLVDRVVFQRAMASDELCRLLPSFDIFAVRNDYWGMPKTVLEAFLSGLPTVINRPVGGLVPELTDDICCLTDGSADGFRSALLRLISDGALRERIGRAAYARAMAEWAPANTEHRYVEIYRKILGTIGCHS